MLKILYRDKIKNNKIVLLQGENGRKLIEKKLKKDGFKICLIECYKRVVKVLDSNIEIKKWRFYKINTLLITSSEALYEIKNIISNTNQNQWLFKCKIFVVGRRLLQIAKKLGWKDIIVSNYANNEHFLETIKKINVTTQSFGRRKRI
ncbi:MAG: uroporphyrinogen-III synthase [Buchnera aphidicola (Macrosiphum albifrons)]|uniref:Uroporphyrinogen-III synthase n=1 Tax=Buchnera aphidicola (Macrosiphum albifrons) TaxID=2994844 RepID=A0AAJ5PUG8_9GAMM|nr:MAG: uroporphyrinogen-III synthase [Buchnera aphidicola (Macrosiphum albifrons)]